MHQSKPIRFYLKILRFVENPQFCDARLWRVACSVVQDSRSMKPRFRNANLRITHVLDLCVKLLAVLQISSAQGRSVDLSVEIATGRRRMIDIISTLGLPAAAQYQNNEIAALDGRSCCIIHRRCLMHNSMDSPKEDRNMVCVCCATILHAPRWCILPRIKVLKAACTTFQASPHDVLRSPPTLSPAHWRAPGKEDKGTLLAAYPTDHHAPTHSR